MKKSALRGVFTIALFFLLCGTVNADIYTNTVDFTGDTINVGYIFYPEYVDGVLLNGINQNYDWQHAVTNDFRVPYDTVNSATLKISGWGIGGNNDTVFVELINKGTLTGNDLLGWKWLWDLTTTEFNLANIFVSWSAGTPLDINLNYNDTAGGFLLTQSIFTLNYENGEAPTVPIPGTLLMLGTGLIGLLGIRRRFAAN